MNKKYDYSELEKNQDFSAHVLNVDESKILKNIKIDKNYNYNPKNIFFRFFSFMLRVLFYLVMPAILLWRHGLIVKGRRNISGVKGAVSVSNHVLELDGPISAIALMPRRILPQSQEYNFKMKGIRHFLRLLGVMPIPESLTARQSYIKATNEFLNNGHIIHINPEASLWPYYDNIRPFNSGAFYFAVKNQVPIIPMVINFREPKGIFKYLRSKDRLVTVHIGKPIYANKDLHEKMQVADLLNRTQKNMQRMNKFYKWLDAKTVLNEDSVEVYKNN